MQHVARCKDTEIHRYTAGDTFGVINVGKWRRGYYMGAEASREIVVIFN